MCDDEWHDIAELVFSRFASLRNTAASRRSCLAVFLALASTEWVASWCGDAEVLAAVAQFVEDLQHGRPARRSLRVKRVRGHDGVFEMTWAANGRATFAYGEEQSAGQAHIIWRRIGGHDIFRRP